MINFALGCMRAAHSYLLNRCCERTTEQQGRANRNFRIDRLVHEPRRETSSSELTSVRGARHASERAVSYRSSPFVLMPPESFMTALELERSCAS
jgi:hypothetical protein